jgi:hypothetical protein
MEAWPLFRRGNRTAEAYPAITVGRGRPRGRVLGDGEDRQEEAQPKDSSRYLWRYRRISRLAHDFLRNSLGDGKVLNRNDRLAAPAWPRRGWVTRARLAFCHGMGGDLFCKPGGLLFECLADQNPFSLRWIITLCVVEAHRDDSSPNWLAQHIGLLVVSVSTDGRTIDKDRGEGWARNRGGERWGRSCTQ